MIMQFSCISSLLCVQTAANRAREQVLAQVSAAREALEEEEQRLLEEVQRESERVEQCLLTQRAHWSQALENLSQTRSSLVHTLTHSPDAQLAVRGIFLMGGWCEGEGSGAWLEIIVEEQRCLCSNNSVLIMVIDD